MEAFSQRRVKIMAAAFFVEIALFFVFSGLPMSSAEYQAIISSPAYQQIDKVRSESLMPRALSIFENNFLIASLEIIPVLGPAVFVYTAYYTARVLDAIGYGQGVSGPILVVDIMLYPHSWLELPAYAVAVAQSLLLVYSAIRKRFFEEVVRSFFVWLFVGLELFVAGIVESGLLELSEKSWLLFVLWLSTLALISAGYILYRRAQGLLVGGAGRLV